MSQHPLTPSAAQAIDNLLSLSAQDIVKRLRDDKWSLREIAERIGVDHAAVSRIADGTYRASEATMIALQRIAVEKRMISG